MDKFSINFPVRSAVSMMHVPKTSQQTAPQPPAPRPSMSKHKVQKKSNIQVGTKVITAKKAVNGYIIFRSAMSALFPACTQSQRSTFVRIMWEKEQHKTSYSLIGKVWTHIRNNTQYRDLTTFITGAQRICGVVPTDEFFCTYNLSFFQHPDSSIELLQTMPVGPDSIP